MKPITNDLSWLYMVLGVGLFVVLMVLGARARLQYVRRVRQAQTRGAFADLNASENKSRFRRLATLTLIGSLGTIVFGIILLWQLLNRSNTFFGILVLATAILGTIASVAGFLMRREIERRI